MASFAFPILLWKDGQNGHHGVPVDGDAESVASGESSADVVRQIKDHLQWQFRNELRWFPPDFEDPRLERIRVEVRPQTEHEKRTYPSSQPVQIEVPCVVGRRESGLIVCAAPLLGMEFDLHEEEPFRAVVSERLRWALSMARPQDIAALAAPPGLRVETVHIAVKVRERTLRPPPRIERLSTVAAPVGAKGFRRRLSRAWLRDDLIRQLALKLGHERTSVLLVGPRGVGKTAVLIDAVRPVEAGRLPPREVKEIPSEEERERNEARREEPDSDEKAPLFRQRYWMTSAGRLIAGMKYLGEWEERLEGVIEELGGIDGVLCIENLLDLVRTGGADATDSLAAFLMPYLAHGELRVVGEATPDELEACRRLLPGLVDCFQLVPVREFEPAAALAAMTHVAESLEREFGVSPVGDVLPTVHRLFGRYLPYRTFPGAAVEFLTDLFERVAEGRRVAARLAGTPAAGEGAAGGVTSDAARRLFAQRTGLPETFLRDDSTLAAEDVLEALSRRVIGQERACRLAADVIATYKAGLNDPQRPVGVLLFCGPTGVGKTELAKAVSKYLFGHGDETNRLMRIDCSEYAGFGSAERLIAKPDGSPGLLIERVRRQPFVVVLFDEIEKASDDVFDVLLSLLEEGRLTDRFGRTTYFRSALIVMTSNLGVRRGASLGFLDKQAPNYERAVLDHFRPEFVNRLDAIVPFGALPREVVVRIARKELAELSEREGLAAAHLRLTFSERLVERVADRGFDPRLGARPLQRFLEETVVQTLSQHLIANPDLKRQSLHLDATEGGEIVITQSV